MTSVMLVEDHPIFAQVLLRFLQERGHLEVVAVAKSAEEALDQIPDLKLDLILVDVSLPVRSGISLVLFLHEKYPELPCIMLSGHRSSQYARGYLIKDHAEGILEGIQHVLHGEIYVSEELRDF
jgi:DNA-binding NarL/FixJ family response regulator